MICGGDPVEYMHKNKSFLKKKKKKKEKEPSISLFMQQHHPVGLFKYTENLVFKSVETVSIFHSCCTVAILGTVAADNEHITLQD